MPALLETRNLCKIHRPGTRSEVRALEDVSLSVAAGSCVAFTGPSGSGKTTLLALLGALERPSHGQVLFQGRNLGSDSDMELTRIRRKMGFVFQDFALIPSLAVWENITYPLIPRGMSGRERVKLAQSLLEELGMPDKLYERPHELSGGEQQRVAIARALAGRPDVILADEPTSNLDTASAVELMAILKNTYATGTTLILSSHDPRVLAIAATVYQLNSGRLAATDSPPTTATSLHRTDAV
jgi:putative ABC transport system ATP-binding protein